MPPSRARSRSGDRRTPGADGESFYKRSAYLVAYWQEAQAVLHNYATNVVAHVSPEDLLLVSQLDRWTPFEDARALLGTDPVSEFAERLTRLVGATVLQELSDPPPGEEQGFRGWGGWLPAAAFFHQATKDFVPRKREPGLSFSLRSEAAPPTPPRRGPEHAARMDLPAFPTGGSFPELLSSRRTWRRFGDQPIDLQQVGALLGLTWSVQKWVQGTGEWIPLKSSPSGGGRHSIEVYLLANQVGGLEGGVYHYDPDEHAVQRLDSRHGAELTETLLPQETPAFRSAKAVFFMTTVFSRVQWRYKSARAYRNIFLEAGHLAQTFCLAATWLRLAPFCTGALNDSAIEELLGIDGAGESVIYATGVGSRPPQGWAPWPDSGELPITTPPSYARRRNAETEE